MIGRIAEGIGISAPFPRIAPTDFERLPKLLATGYFFACNIQVNLLQCFI